MQDVPDQNTRTSSSFPSPPLHSLLSFSFPNVFSFFQSAAGIRLSQPLSELYTSRNPTLEIRHRVHLQLGTRAVLRAALSFCLLLKWPPLLNVSPLKGTRPFPFPSPLSCVNSLAPLAPLTHPNIFFPIASETLHLDTLLAHPISSFVSLFFSFLYFSFFSFLFFW